jgi:hypothetical protein
MAYGLSAAQPLTSTVAWQAQMESTELRGNTAGARDYDLNSAPKANGMRSGFAADSA